ncbi:MAG: hypothetical protein E3J56_00580 [Candidatus Aminicenantes bacterium]|nr:MAG: hypothetical protein E3J56_00580 [Candidatus Aminicenantes bacterium]
MKKINYFSLAALLILSLCSFSYAQFQEEESSPRISIKPGIGFEYFSRTISWDDDKYSSNLKSYFFILNVEFEIQEGFSLNALAGYSFSNFDSLIFRELPFSVELDVGDMSGFLFGGEIKKSIFSINDFEVEGLGQFVYYLGSKKEWDIPDLNVEGSVTGKPWWMRASAGPVITYTGFDYFYPYIYLSYNKLWGKFKMEQTIQELSGSEDKKITGKSVFSTSLGAIYEVFDALTLKAEASFMPYNKGLDFGVMLRAMYSF